MKRLVSLIMAVIISIALSNSSEALAKSNSITVIEPKYEYLEDLSSTYTLPEESTTAKEVPLFSFQKGEKYGIINDAGTVIAKAEYDYIYSNQNGYVIVKKDNKIGYMDSTGKLITKIKYDLYSSDGFHDGLAHVAVNGKYGFINTSGKEVIKLQYDAAFNFVDGVAPICIDGKWGLIDKNGKVIIKPQYDEMGSFVNGLAWVLIKGKIGYVNAKNKLVIPAEYEKADELDADFDFGTSIVLKDGKYGIIDKQGKYVAEPSYQSIRKNASNQLYIVQKNDKYGVLDAKGKVILKPIYTNIFIKDSILCASTDGTAQLFSTKGKLVIDRTFSNIDSGFGSSTSYTSFIFSENGKYGAIICR